MIAERQSYSHVLALLVVTAACLLAPAAARGAIVEMGAFGDDTPEAACPEAECSVMARVTGFQKRLAGDSDVFTVPRNGRIVAWSLRLSEPNAEQVEFFEENYGGEPQANITVFRMGKKKANRGIGTNIGHSGVQDLTDYLGQDVQFPMANTIRVRKGDRIALTSPTWTPALADELDNGTRWRATRNAEDCNDASTFFQQRAIRELGTETPFPCAYRATQLLYSVTLITQPKRNKRPARDENRRDRDENRR